MKQSSIERLPYLDVAKGLGIFLVVFGHNHMVFSPEKGMLYSMIFSCHMPLFYFISGLFHKTSEAFTEIAAKKSRTLLTPYFVTCIAIALVPCPINYAINPAIK